MNDEEFKLKVKEYLKENLEMKLEKVYSAWDDDITVVTLMIDGEVVWKGSDYA